MSVLTLKVVLTLLCIKVTGPALKECLNEHVEKVTEFVITPKTYVRRLKRKEKIISNNPVQETNVFILM